MNDIRKGNVFLLLSAIIWGFAMVAQKAGMDHLGPFGFTAIRCTLGGISMIPVVLYINKFSPAAKSGAISAEYGGNKKETLICSLICGVCLASLILCQQFGLPYTSVGKAAFITALYIPFTPMLERLTGKRISRNVWIAGAIALVGMYLLCMTDGLSGFNKGDLFMVAAAICVSIQMIAVGKCVKKVEPVKLSCYQFLVTGLICAPFMLIFETVTWQAVSDSMIPILYAGLISCGFGYTFQVIGQKFTTASQAAIVLATETVFSLIAGAIFYKEVMSLVEYLGCALMFVAILISQKQDNQTH